MRAGCLLDFAQPVSVDKVRTRQCPSSWESVGEFERHWRTILQQDSR
jgi:hypothetical protein